MKVARVVVFGVVLAVGIAQVTSSAVITGIERRFPDDNSGDTEPVIVVGGLVEGVVTFVDRTYIYKNVPSVLVGIDYVKVANDDKDNPNYELDVTVGQDATLLLFIDWRIGDDDNTNPPTIGAVMGWVNSMGFVDTGLRIDIDENPVTESDVDQFFSVYSRNVVGLVTLTLSEQNNGTFRNMYGVAAVPGSLNMPPVVNAGSDQVIVWPDNAVQLDVTVTDDGNPVPPGEVTLTWSVQSKPEGSTVQFEPNKFVEDPAATFDKVGTYILRLTAYDGLIFASDDVTVTVKEPEKGCVLESSELRIILSRSPYSFTVIEKSTGQTLLSQKATSLVLSGVRYFVESAYDVVVLEAEMDAELVLSGTSARGHVNFSFESPNVAVVILTCSGGTPSNMKEEFIDQGEHYYGIWEYPQGRNIDTRGADADLLGFGDKPYTNWCNARAPFYVTSGKYGVYADSIAKGHYSVAVGGRTSFDFDSPQLKYYVVYGPSYEDILSRFNSLAGAPIMPPDWAFGSIWWRDDDHQDLGHWDLVDSKQISSAQDNVVATANHLRYYQIPASAIWIDRPYTSGSWGWGYKDFNPASDWFPDAQEMINNLGSKGYKLLLWIANRCYGQLKTEALAYGYIFSGYEGQSSPAADMRIRGVYNWFKSKLDVFAGMGVRGYKIDRGEEGEMPNWVQNENTYLFSRLSWEGQVARYGNDHLIFARNVYDKCRRYMGVWNGDTDSTFGGLAVSVKNGLRCGAMNMPLYGSDTGGYGCGYTPNKELFARWLEFSTYCTMMEVLIGPNRTIWYSDQDYQVGSPNLIEIARKQAREHHDLMPYTKSCMYEATQTGMPVMRQLIFAYPEDSNLYDMWDEYLYGSEILVAPVVTGGVTSRSVNLPEGKWLDYNNKSTVYAGPRNIAASAPIDVIPLFVREGAIIVRGDILRSNNNWTAGWSPYLRIEFFPCEDCVNVFNYYTGSQVRPISCSMPGDGRINIHFGDLVYGGNLEIYCKGYANVTKNGIALVEGVDFTYDSVKKLMTIPFSSVTTVGITGSESIFAIIR